AQSKGLPALDERKSLGQFLESWLATMEHQVKAGTWVRYQQHLAHLLVELKRMPIARLLPQQIEMLYAQLLSDGLSSTTVHSLHTVLHNALNDALRLGAVSRNVTALIDPPRPRRSEMQVLTPDQAKMFLAACNGERFEALYILALTTGMREGELLALLGRT
ncbi:MAG TPA: hypothetical protein VFU69_09995, partial [Ktedonobacterales bacterium]|nr:hypothetical protein [Ktedonobacterales bacterium]